MKKYKFYVTCYKCEKTVEGDYALNDGDFKFICLDCLYDKKEEGVEDETMC